jgi:hypothetical protein
VALLGAFAPAQVSPPQEAEPRAWQLQEEPYAPYARSLEAVPQARLAWARAGRPAERVDSLPACSAEPRGADLLPACSVEPQVADLLPAASAALPLDDSAEPGQARLDAQLAQEHFPDEPVAA